MPAIFLLSGIFFINSFGTNNISPGQIKDISRLFLIILALPVTPISPIEIPLETIFLTKPTFIKSVEPLMPVNVPAV